MNEETVTNKEILHLLRDIIDTQEMGIKNMENFIKWAKNINVINENNIEAIRLLRQRKTDHTHWWL